jgi:cell shape-determining protein MreD
MRWILWIILAYLALTVQNVLGILVFIPTSWPGDIRPDILAAAAVFVAFSAKNPLDVVIACWLLGLGLDLTSGQGVVGPMPLAYSAAAYVVFRMRDAFFRDRLSSQIILTGVFALLAHVTWITLQLVLALGAGHWESYGRMLIQACLLAVYSGLLAPVIFALLGRCSRWLITPAASRGSRER